MDSMKNQNKVQSVMRNVSDGEPSLNRFNEEGSSSDSFSQQDKKQLVDFFALLLEWDLEEKEKEKGN